MDGRLWPLHLMFFYDERERASSPFNAFVTYTSEFRPCAREIRVIISPLENDGPHHFVLKRDP